MSISLPASSSNHPFLQLQNLPFEILQHISSAVLGNGREEEAIKDHLNTISSIRQACFGSSDSEERKKTINEFRSPDSVFYSQSILERLLPPNIRTEAIQLLYMSNVSSAGPSTSESPQVNSRTFQARFYWLIHAYLGAKLPPFFAQVPTGELFKTSKLFPKAFAEWQGKIEYLPQVLHNRFNGLALEVLKDYPLHHAALAGDADSIKVLIERFPKEKLPDSLKLSILHLAVYSTNVQAVKAIIEKKPSFIVAKDAYDYTPIHEAVKLGHLSIVQAFIDYSNQVKDPSLLTTSDAFGKTMVHLAAEEGHLSVIQAIIETNPTLLMVTDDLGRTPLHRAARKGHLKVVQAIIDHSKQIKDSSLITATANNGMTPLHKAGERGHLDIAQAIIDYGRQIKDYSLFTAEDLHNRTPLDYAKLFTNSDFLKNLQAIYMKKDA